MKKTRTSKIPFLLLKILKRALDLCTEATSKQGQWMFKIQHFFKQLE